MDTSRAKINIYDNSSTYEEETTSQVGFTVVRAPKGPCRPVRIYKGGAAKIKDIFGISSKDYPELFEAETFNREYDLWISAPYEQASVPVAYVTGDGIFEGADNVAYEQDDLEAFVMGEKEDDEISIFNGDASVKKEIPATFSLDSSKKITINTGLPFDDFYGASGLKTTDTLIVNNTTEIILTSTLVTDSSDYEVKIGEDVAGSAKKTDDKLVIELNAVTEGTETSPAIPNFNAETATLSQIHKISSDDVYAVIFPKYPSERRLHISFAPFDAITNYDGTKWQNRNILKISAYEEGAFRDAGHSISVTGSLNLQELDGNGAPIGFTGANSSYAGQDLFCVYVKKAFTEDSSFDKNLNGYQSVDLEGGTRVLDKENSGKNSVLEKGWELAGQDEYSEVTVFFSSANPENGQGLNDLKTSKFFGLADDDIASHELAGYIFNYTLKPEDILDDDGKAKAGLIDNKLTFGRNYWNTANIGIVENRNDGTRFPVVMTGAKAVMQCRINEVKLGGAAPMWQNITSGGKAIGGQLDMISVYKLKYKYNKKMQDLLDNLNYNPVISDRQYGLIVTGQKTCQGGNTTDWSYIGHAAAFLNFLKQVRENVMIPQIGKPNNPYYRTLRKDQVDAYLAQRLNGSDRIWAEASCDTSTADGINDIYALKARKFVINVRVKVDIFSETVELNFTNEDQETFINAE